MKGRNRAWVRRKMVEARRTFLSLSDPMNKIQRTIIRKCVVCEKDIEITYNRITKSYVGGHYFFGKGTEYEYWECEECNE